MRAFSAAPSPSSSCPSRSAAGTPAVPRRTAALPELSGCAPAASNILYVHKTPLAPILSIQFLASRSAAAWRAVAARCVTAVLPVQRASDCQLGVVPIDSKSSALAADWRARARGYQAWLVRSRYGGGRQRRCLVAGARCSFRLCEEDGLVSGREHAPRAAAPRACSAADTRTAAAALTRRNCFARRPAGAVCIPAACARRRGVHARGAAGRRGRGAAG